MPTCQQPILLSIGKMKSSSTGTCYMGVKLESFSLFSMNINWKNPYIHIPNLLASQSEYTWNILIQSNDHPTNTWKSRARINMKQKRESYYRDHRQDNILETTSARSRKPLRVLEGSNGAFGVAREKPYEIGDDIRGRGEDSSQ